MKNILNGFIIAAILSATTAAQAVIIDLGSASGSPASASARLGRLNDKIDAYNLDNDPDLPEAVLDGNYKSGSLSGLSIDIDVSGWTYLVLKWANTDRYWYVGSEAGVINFPSTSFNANDQPQNLSGYSLFNPRTSQVPDGGSSLVLLGLGVVGLLCFKKVALPSRTGPVANPEARS